MKVSGLYIIVTISFIVLILLGASSGSTGSFIAIDLKIENVPKQLKSWINGIKESKKKIVGKLEAITIWLAYNVIEVRRHIIRYSGILCNKSAPSIWKTISE